MMTSKDAAIEAQSSSRLVKTIVVGTSPGDVGIMLTDAKEGRIGDVSTSVQEREGGRRLTDVTQ